MSGNGHIIIRSAAKEALTNPLIHGQLPIPALIDQILAKEPDSWSSEETCTVGHYFLWALKNC